MPIYSLTLNRFILSSLFFFFPFRNQHTTESAESIFHNGFSFFLPFLTSLASSLFLLGTSAIAFLFAFDILPFCSSAAISWLLYIAMCVCGWVGARVSVCVCRCTCASMRVCVCVRVRVLCVRLYCVPGVHVLFCLLGFAWLDSVIFSFLQVFCGL